MDDANPPRSGLLVLTVWPGPRGGLVARLRMTIDVADGESTVVSCASPSEILDQVRGFLDRAAADWAG